jgi:hypothetical protein
VPRRSNLFQEVIVLIHHHLAGEATVEESAMLIQRTTEAAREVDVVLRSSVAGHEIVVAIEARATTRKADLPWVESMLAKHADLPTTKLVLVSEAGFTADARRHAEAKGAAPVAPEDLAGDHPARSFIESFASLSLCEVVFVVDTLYVLALRATGETLDGHANVGVRVYRQDGDYLGTLNNLIRAAVEADVLFFEGVDPYLDAERPLTILRTLRPPWHIIGGGVADDVYVQLRDGHPKELARIAQVDVKFAGTIDASSTIEMTGAQLGGAAYAVGETTLDNKPAIAVLTADSRGGELSIRTRGRGPWRMI